MTEAEARVWESEQAIAHGAAVPGATSGAVSGALDPALAQAWEAEPAYATHWRDIPGPAGPECGQCGTPMTWTGAHTALVCSGPGHERPVWSVSPGARERLAAHLAEIDRTAARKSAQLADPEAERVAAETLAAERAVMLDDLDDLAAMLDVSDWPAGADDEVRRQAIRAAGIVDHYAGRIRSADKLDQLRRAADDLARFRWTISAAPDGNPSLLTEIASIRRGQAPYPGDWDVIEGEVIGDDEDQDDDTEAASGADDDTEARDSRIMRRMLAIRDRAAITAGQPASLTGGLTVAAGTACDQCKRDRQYVNGAYPAAVARAEWPGLAPSPADLCAGHLTLAMAEHGRALSVIELLGAKPAYAAVRSAR